MIIVRWLLAIFSLHGGEEKGEGDFGGITVLIEMENVRARVVVEGRVQGVFFRSHTQEMAETLGLKGWVKNRRDGRVEAVFEGDKEKVEQMIQWCRRGPSGARVTNVQTNREEYSGEFEDFSIRY